MKKQMMLMGAMSMAAIAQAMEHSYMDETPRPRIDTSKSSTLSGKEQKRRKRRNKMASRSRKHNRQ